MAENAVIPTAEMTCEAAPRQRAAAPCMNQPWIGEKAAKAWLPGDASGLSQPVVRMRKPLNDVRMAASVKTVSEKLLSGSKNFLIETVDSAPDFVGRCSPIVTARNYL